MVQIQRLPDIEGKPRLLYGPPKCATQTGPAIEAPSLIVKLMVPTKPYIPAISMDKPGLVSPALQKRKRIDASDDELLGILTSKHKVPKAEDTYINSLLQHQRRVREERSAVSQRVKELEAENASFHELKRRNNILRAENRALLNEIKKLKTTCKARGNAIRDYSRAAEACKPIILEAIEEKLDSEAMDGGNQGLQGNTLLSSKERAQAEYEKHFCAAEIEISDDAK